MFNRFSDSVRRLFFKLQGLLSERYGNDALNIFLFAAGCVLTLILSIVSRITHLGFLRLFSYIPFILALLRLFSKNIYKRQSENEKFLRMGAPALAFIKKKMEQYKDKQHRYFPCPVCKKTLRVPSGRGKIEITCPHCGKKFKRRT